MNKGLKVTLGLLLISLTVNGTVLFRLYQQTVSEKSVEMKLSPYIYAVSGQELNIYFDNMMNARDSEYDFNIVCDVGELYEGYYRLVSDRGGVFPITIQAIKNGNVVGEASSEIIVADECRVSDTLTCLVIGDSTVCSAYLIPSLSDDFESDGIPVKFLGTQGEEPYKQEGRDGWTIEKYLCDAESPFVYEGKFDFARYMSDNHYEDVDYIFIHLGINDFFSITEDDALELKVREALKDFEVLTDAISAYDKNTVVGVCVTIPPAYTQDAFGELYGVKYPRWRYKINNYIWTSALIEHYGDLDKAYLVPINVNLDTKNNMGFQEVRLNAHNNKTHMITASGGHVHPAESGYWQMADEMYYFIRCMEDGNINENR